MTVPRLPEAMYARALAATHQAECQREEYRQKLVQMERAAEEGAALHEARLKLQPNDPVRVQRFDKAGRIVRIDHKKNVAVVSVSSGLLRLTPMILITFPPSSGPAAGATESTMGVPNR